MAPELRSSTSSIIDEMEKLPITARAYKEVRDDTLKDIVLPRAAPLHENTGGRDNGPSTAPLPPPK